MQITPIEGGALLGGLNWPTDPTNQQTQQGSGRAASKAEPTEKKDGVEDELQKLVQAGKILPSDAAAIFDRAIQAKRILESDPTILASNPQRAKELLQASNVSNREISQALLAKANYDQIRTHSEKSGSFDNYVGSGSSIYVANEDGKFSFIQAESFDPNKHTRVKVGQVLDMRAQNQPLADGLLTIVQGAKGFGDIQKEITDAFAMVSAQYTGKMNIDGTHTEVIKSRLKTNQQQRAIFGRNMWMRLDDNSKNYYYQQAISHGKTGKEVGDAAVKLMMSDFLESYTMDTSESDVLLKENAGKNGGRGGGSEKEEKSQLSGLYHGTMETGSKITIGHKMPIDVVQVGSAPYITNKGERFTGFFSLDRKAFRQNKEGKTIREEFITSATSINGSPWTTLDNRPAFTEEGQNTAAMVAFRSTGADDMVSIVVPKGTNPLSMYHALDKLAVSISKGMVPDLSQIPKEMRESAEFKAAIAAAKSKDKKKALDLLTSAANELTHQNIGGQVDVYLMSYIYKTESALKTGGNNKSLWEKVTPTERDQFYSEILDETYYSFLPTDDEIYKSVAFAKYDKVKAQNFEGGMSVNVGTDRHPDNNAGEVRDKYGW